MISDMETTGAQKKVYATPTLRVEGTLGSLTQGSQNGNFTDMSFPAHTPKNQLTFS
jgi:hypothetical protein